MSESAGVISIICISEFVFEFVVVVAAAIVDDRAFAVVHIVVVVTRTSKGELFAFMCLLDHAVE